MHQKKVVIADANEDFTAALAQELSGKFAVKICADGAQAMELVRRWEPDILIMELTLAYVDGIAIIRQLPQLPRYPQVLVISGILSEFTVCVLDQLGIQYALKKPCPVHTAVERVLEIDALSTAPKPYPGLYTAMTAELLMELGLSNQLLGFHHMLSAIPLLMVRRDRRLTKELYEEICASSDTCPTRIEKNIRDALRHAWAARDPAVWEKYFPGAVRCPGNKAFLFRMTDVLMEQILRKAV